MTSQTSHYSTSSSYVSASQVSNRDPVRFDIQREPIDSQASRRPVSREKLHIPMPPVPDSFPELNKLSVDRLKRLLSDNAAINVCSSKLIISRI